MKEVPSGINLWTTPAYRAGKTSKMELIRGIAIETGSRSLDIGLLSLSDLNKILKVAKMHPQVLTQPQGRLKQPYIEALLDIIPNIKGLEKLQVSSLKALIGAFSK